jgi:hypothetical protein
MNIEEILKSLNCSNCGTRMHIKTVRRSLVEKLIDFPRETFEEVRVSSCDQCKIVVEKRICIGH